MPRYLFSSHDGFGLGHVRRNTTIAQAIVRADSEAHVLIATGVSHQTAWQDDPRITTLALPPLLKASDGSYRNPGMSFEGALAQRSQAFDAAIERFDPDVVVVDRHPYGIGGELRPGLARARRQGAKTVLGLRDVLDEPTAVTAELAGPGWADVEQTFDQILVYGDPCLCDHRREYGLDLPLDYVGWVVDAPLPPRPEPDLVLVAAGGGGDGDEVYHLGLEALSRMPERRGLILAGPYASTPPALAGAHLRERVGVRRCVTNCADLYARAGAVIQMAGYNSTFEALAAGLRPLLVPRRAPRREQAIRAGRLAALGLVNCVDEAAHPEEVVWFLRRNQRVSPAEVAARGIRLDGAQVTGRLLGQLALARTA